MPRFVGYVGFATQEETSPGIWEEVIVEKKCTGVMLSDVRRPTQSGNVNANITLTNRISIVANKYVIGHAHEIVYVSSQGNRWRVTAFEYQRPKIILNFGGIWNGKEPIKAAQ